MTELGPKSRALFASARRDFAISTDERARMDAALAAKLGSTALAATVAAKGAGASLPPAGAAGATTGGATAATIPLTLKIVGTLAIIGAASGGAALYASRRPEPVLATSSPGTTNRPNVEAQAPRPVASSEPIPLLEVNVVPPARVEPSRPSPAEAPSASPVRRPIAPAMPSPSAPSPKGSTGGVAVETRLLRDADAALRSGDATQALAILDDHARLYPNGVLREERSAERIFALCKLGRVPEARVESTRFLQENGESPLAASVRSSCGGREGMP